ncbi:helix-turn-helix domain-containing protein [Rummeliibacillus suwonensis]|uniref:helix-turn-helix domain-containing protein n=1 Tax=Rummeliibacillus suwonensis TaxID=1306154 RepID=UPI0035E3EBEE
MGKGVNYSTLDALCKYFNCDVGGILNLRIQRKNNFGKGEQCMKKKVVSILMVER